MGGEHGEEVRTGRQAGEKSIEERKRGIGVGPGGKDVQDRRQQLRQPLSGFLAADGAVATFVPSSQRLERLLRPGVAHGGESLQRLAIVAFAAEVQRTRCREFRLVLEERRIVALHGPQMGDECLDEGVACLEAEEGRDLRDALLVVRHAVGLSVVRHLQPMLERAVKDIGLHQLYHHLAADMAGAHQTVEGLARAAHAQRRIPPTPDELLRLRQKFDLADAAPPELDVVSGDGDLAAAAVSVDLALDRANVLDGGEVEVSAPDEGLQPAEESGSGLDVPGHGLRLDHGGSLPILAGGRVVGLGRADGKRRRGRAGVGAEAEVGAEHVTVRRPLVHDRDQVAGEPGEDLLQPVAAGVFGDLLVEEDDDVHVARIVELAGAELSHAEDDEAGAPLGRLRVRQGELAPVVKSAQQVGADGAQRGRGDVREGAGHPLQRPHRGDVGHADGEARAALRDAKASHHLLPRLVTKAARVLRHLASGGKGGLGPLLDQQAREGLIGGEAVAEVATVPEERVQESARGGIALARLGEGDEVCIFAAGGVLAPALPAERQRRLIRRQGRPCRRIRPCLRYVHGQTRSIIRPSSGAQGQVIGRESSCRRSKPTGSISTTS